MQEDTNRIMRAIEVMRGDVRAYRKMAAKEGASAELKAEIEKECAARVDIIKDLMVVADRCKPSAGLKNWMKGTAENPMPASVDLSGKRFL